MLGSYLALAWKVLQRRKFFTFASLFGVGLTLVVLTLGAALLDYLFGTHPPETRRTLGLYGLSMVTDQGSQRSGFVGWAFLDRYVRDLPGAEAITFFRVQRSVASYLGDAKVVSHLKQADGGYWRVLDFEFVEGGPYTADDERQAQPVAVINERTRERFFGGAPAVGRTLEADGQRFRVVGVVRDVPYLRFAAFADIWVPISTSRTDAYKDNEVADFMALVVAPPERLDDLRREMAQRIAAARPRDPQFERFQGGLETFFEFASRLVLGQALDQARPGALRALLAALALLFMLLPAINLVNLNLSRILERAPEIGVRRAFGASSWTLAGQFLVENLVLSLLGGLLGLVVAAGVFAAINATGAVPYVHLSLNPRVFLWGLAFSVAFGLLSGVYPAWRMSRLHPVAALRGSSL